MKRKKYLFCILAGILLFILAEAADSQSASVEKGIIYRQPCGKGEAEYAFYVDGLGEQREKISISVPEQQLSGQQFKENVPEIKKLLSERILGENPSFSEVRNDLELVTEVEEYGVSVSWSSERPELVSRLGTVYTEEIPEDGCSIVLRAVISCGDMEESWEIPITVYPQIKTKRKRFEAMLNNQIVQNEERREIFLPTEFENEQLTYRSASHSQNAVLLILGIVGAGCLWIKEKNDQKERKKQREDSLLAAYQELISGFLILTGAGYPIKAAWKKLTRDFGAAGKKQMQILVQEMQIAENQMDTGTSETQAYTLFGRRCGIRCYIRFASLLESNLSTGGKNLRNLLEAEMNEAFKERTDIARRKGEEASSKLLLPMFGMLGVVMVMVVAPAFLSIH